MKSRFNPILAAILASGACSLGHTAVAVAAVASTPEVRSEVRSEVRTVIIDSDAAIGNNHAAADIVIAQGAPGRQKREVKIITSGEHADFTDMPDVHMIMSKAMSEAFAGTSAMPMARNVKNAPYRAEVIAEKLQTLPDGNQISRKTSSMAYRDSAGRTRQETRDSKGDIRSIQIHDAVDGSRYVLSPARKTATRISIDKDLHKRIEEMKEKARAMAKDGKAQIIEQANPGEEIIVKRIETPAADGKQEVREEVKVRVVRPNTGTGPAASRASHAAAGAHANFDGESIGRAISESMRHGPIGMSFQDMKWSAKSVTTPLGMKDFDGVRAEGKNVSYTIPAGEIGNRNPIVVSTETWTSPDLQVVVYSRHSDPRVGDSIYRLANVNRAEQPPTLFTVPEGYRVKETPGFSIGTKQK